MRVASIGPGAPSGWNWTDAIRPLDVREPLDGPVVQVAMADAVAGRPQRRAVDDLDLVVVRADVDPAGGRFQDGVVAAVVADRQTSGLGAGRQAEQLVAEADAEDRRAARDGVRSERSYRLDLRRHPRRVARTGRQHDEVRRAGRRHPPGVASGGSADHLDPAPASAARSERFTP